MSKKILTGVILCVFLFAGLAVLRTRSPVEPTYKGKPVSHWMLETRSQRLEDNEGLSAIGINALPFLIRILKTRQGIFWNSFDMLASKLPLRVQQCLPKLMSKDEAYQIRVKAIISLKAFGFEATPALPALYKLFLDENPAIQSQSLNAVYLIGPTTEVIPHLIEAWINTNRLHKSNRGEIIALCGRIGQTDPVAVVPLLIQALDDTSAGIHSNAALVLGRIGHPAPEAVPRLIAMLEDKSLRAEAAYALGRAADDLESLIPKLRLMLQGDDLNARASAALTLLRFPEERERAFKEISNLLDNRVHGWFLAKGLGEIGAPAKEAVPALLRLAQAEAVLRIDPTASAAVDVLVEALRDPKPSIRQQAPLSLASLGSIVHAAVPALEKALQDTNREVRYCAADALRKIKPE